jgi:hypothetical protein
MLRRSFCTLMIACFLMASGASVWAQRGMGRGMRNSGNQGMCPALINSTPKQPLDSRETAGLVYLREVEKLAHDVYATLHSKWNLRVFDNISQSEEHHFEAIKPLLDRYGLADPAANSHPGVFQNRDLQALYGALISQGGLSLNSAVRVGAVIEDMDIRDLESAIAATDNNDLKLVFENLRQASENHMSTFIRQLESAGDHYVPQYISQARINEILASSQQTGRGMGARGNGQRGFGRGNGTCPWKQ